jgi:2-dehydropantoate 2-reductase
MKTVIVGAGALGTLVGAYLSRGGADITLLDVPDLVKTLNRQDVEIKTLSGQSFKVSLRATHNPGSLEDVDLIVVCVKTYHSEAALSSLGRFKHGVQAVLSLQNGVDKELILGKYFGRDKVIGGCCTEAASRVDERTVMHTMRGITYLGELDGSQSSRVASALKLFRDGGLKAEASTEVVSVDWCKWINFAAISAACALTRLPYYKALLSPYSADLIAKIYREYAELAAASGVEIGDYPGFEVKSISRAPADEAVRLLQQRGRNLQQKGATRIMPSLARDLIAGRPTERESIFGFAIKQGHAKKIPMTFTRLAYALITAVEESSGCDYQP